MTKITLRKALKLKRQIESALHAPTASVTIDIDDPTSEDVKSFFASREEDFKSAVTDFARLSTLLANLRHSIDVANAELGVSFNLSQVGHVDRMISLHKQFVDLKPANADIVQARILRKREQLKGGVQQAPTYGRSMEEPTNVSVFPVSAEQIEYHKAELVKLRQEKESLEDHRTAMNASAAVEIGDDDITFLAGRGIV